MLVKTRTSSSTGGFSVALFSKLPDLSDAITAIEATIERIVHDNLSMMHFRKVAL